MSATRCERAYDGDHIKALVGRVMVQPSLLTPLPESSGLKATDRQSSLAALGHGWHNERLLAESADSEQSARAMAKPAIGAIQRWPKAHPSGR
jgi:hypothetical protein